MEGNTLFNLEGTGSRMLEKRKRADGASTNNIKAQRSGFDVGRRSNEAIRSFRPEAKPEAGNGVSTVCSDDMGV